MRESISNGYYSSDFFHEVILEDKLVSIIIPVRNCASFVSRCIESHLNCSYRHIEILVGDDASTDNTWQVLQKYAQDPRVQLFRQDQNLGAGRMRNFLLSKAQGFYVALQDADDWSSPYRLEKQVKFLEMQSNLEGVGTWAELVDQQELAWGEMTPSESPGVLSWMLQKSFVHATLLIKRADALKASYHENMQFGEDYYYLLSLRQAGVRLGNVTEVLYHYRVSQTELRTRAKRFAFKILKTKIKLSQLFPFPLNYVSLALSFLSTLASIMRGYLFS